MTKFMNFNTGNTKPVKKSTEFRYKIIGNKNSMLEVQTTTYSPNDFDNVVHLYYDKYMEFDVFMAWDEDINKAWIFYGTKGDEFE